MAVSTLAKRTVDLVVSTAAGVLTPLLDRALEAAVAPLAAQIAAQTAEIAAMRVLMAAPRPAEPAAPPSTAPNPAPPAEPVPEGVVDYQVILWSGTDGAWLFRPDGKSYTQRGLAHRYEVTVPREMALVGSLRLVLDIYPSGWADLALRNDGAMILDGGPVTLWLVAYRNGQEVLRVEDDTIHHYTGRLYALGTPVYPAVPTTAALIAAGQIAPYRQGAVLESVLAAWGAAVASEDWRRPGASRGITQYMPATGGREEIGPTTKAQAAYLCCGAPRAWDYMIGQAEVAITIPWHLRDQANGRWLSALDYPHLWTDGRGGTGTPGDRYASGLTQQIPNDTGWTLDSAHQPDLSYVPYLLTGREAFRDELEAQAAWNVLNVWATNPRWEADPQRGADGLLLVRHGQVRHSAWTLRTLDNARATAEPGSYEAAYFAAACDRNWRWLAEQLPDWTAAQGEAHGRIVGGYGTAGALPPWQQHYFAGTAAAAARRGNADALTVLRWMRNFLVGAVVHLRRDACAYLLAVADPQTGAPYRSWAAIQAATEARGWSNGDGWARSHGDYGQLAVFALRSVVDVLGDAEAARCADWLVAEGAPYTAAADYLREPTLRVGVGS